jgi:hypothetical protein
VPVCPDCGRQISARGLQNHRDYIVHGKQVSSVCQQEQIIARLTREGKLPAGKVSSRIRQIGLSGKLERGPVRKRARMGNTWWAPGPLVSAARHCRDDALIRAAADDPDELMRLAAVGALAGKSPAH